MVRKVFRPVEHVRSLHQRERHGSGFAGSPGNPHAAGVKLRRGYPPQIRPGNSGAIRAFNRLLRQREVAPQIPLFLGIRDVVTEWRLAAPLSSTSEVDPRA